MMWKSIRLELARTDEFPEGSPRHLYILHLPLTAEGLVDEASRKAHPELATVHRYWDSERSRSGYVLRTPRGWALSYERGDDDDEVLFHLETHPLRPGEYATIIGPNGRRLPMRVASVQELDQSPEARPNGDPAAPS